MIIDGEKWACEACVRGHRVSNCQHYDRPLQHINKKGRPVTQCQHCRSQRKNRAAHVKCDCGEKTTKCVHLGAIEGHRESCCCNHGGRCSCSFKKDLDPVPETSGIEAGIAEKLSTSAKLASAAAASSASAGASASSSSSKAPVRRRRANTTRSEGTLLFDEHGRHKPVSHKHNKAASHKTGPYPINRLNSVRSTGGLSGFLTAATKSANEEEEADEDDQSSAAAGSDSGLDDDATSSYLAEAAAAAAVATNTGASAHSFMPVQLSQQQQQQQRRSRSETASPLLFSGSFPQPHQLSSSSSLSPLNMGVVSMGAYTNYNSFGGADQADQPLFSAGLSAPSVDWSQFFDAGLNNSNNATNSGGNNSGKFGANPFNFARAYGYEFNGSEQAPTMTTATSGEVSEAEDLMAPGIDDYDFDGTTDAASSSVAFSRTNSSFQLPTVGGAGGDYGDMRILKATNKFLPTPSGTAADEISILAAANGIPHAAGIDDDDAGIWLPEYHGLPSMTESPESDVISFWGTK